MTWAEVISSRSPKDDAHLGGGWRSCKIECQRTNPNGYLPDTEIDVTCAPATKRNERVSADSSCTQASRGGCPLHVSKHMRMIILEPMCPWASAYDDL